MSAKIKVLVVDDSAVVRKVFREELSREKDIEIVGTDEPSRHVQGVPDFFGQLGIGNQGLRRSIFVDHDLSGFQAMV